MKGLKNNDRRTHPTVLVVVLLHAAYCLTAPSAFGVIVNTKLSGPLVAGGDVQNFKISPNSRWVIYRADQDTDEAVELYSVPILGDGVPVRLNGLLPPGDLVAVYAISADSRRVVYIAPQDASGTRELYSVPIEGPAGAGVKLNGPLVAGGNVYNFQISSDGQRVAYAADQDALDQTELYSVPITGPASAAVKLNETLTTSTIVYSQSFRISPDSSRVAYFTLHLSNDTQDLYSVPISGPADASVKLNDSSLISNNPPVLEISPDNARVVYTATQDNPNTEELFSVALAGPAGAGVKLNGSIAPGGDVSDFRISADSQRVVYRADQLVDGVRELFSVSISGPATTGVRLNPPLSGGGDVGLYEISADSARVVFHAYYAVGAKTELYSAPAGGPWADTITLNLSLPSGGAVSGAHVSSDAERVVYRADPTQLGENEIFCVPIGGPAAESRKLNLDERIAGEVATFQISPDARHVVYSANYLVPPGSDTLTQLYRVPIGGPPEASVKLHGRFAVGGDVQLFSISPDSRYVVYRADQQTDGVDELFVSYDRVNAVGSWGGYN